MDFLASVTIFIVVLATILFAWTYVGKESSSQLEMKRMETKAMDISDSLVMTPGVPEDWTPGSVQSLGFAQDEWGLNSTKIASMAGMDYDLVRTKLGAGLYEFYMRIYDKDNQTLDLGMADAEAGTYPDSSKMVAKSQRYVVVDGVPSVMEFYLWF